jgi:hypothetical protein
MYMRRVLLWVIILSLTVLSVNCKQNKNNIISSSHAERPVWVDHDFLENEDDLYFISHKTYLAENKNLLTELAIEHFKAYVSDIADLVYKDSEMVLSPEEKMNLQDFFIKKSVSDNSNDALRMAEFYWEQVTNTSDEYNSDNIYQLNCMITIKKDFFKSKQIRVLHMQALTAKFDKNTELYTYLTARKEFLKSYYNSAKIKKKHYYRHTQ